MSTSSFIATLNRRNKVALCATLVCAGLILLQDGGLRLAVGIILLGVAYSWALGTDRRILHWSFLIFGVLLLVPAIWDAYRWPEMKRELISGYTASISAEDFLIHNDINDPETYGRGLIPKDANDLHRDQQKVRNLQAEGAFHHVIEIEWAPIAAGLLLVGSGLGLLVGIKHAAPSGELPNSEKQVRGHHIN